MERLHREGWIVRRVGKGTFVAPETRDRPATARRTIMLALPDYPSPNYEAYAQIFSRLTQDAGHEARIVRYDWRDKILRTIPREAMEGLIVVPAGARLDVADMYRLKRVNVPFVVMDRLLNGLEIDFVCGDDELGAGMAADHLLKLGHRRLAVLLSEPRVDERRENGFLRQARFGGAEYVETIDCRTISGDSSFRRAYEILTARIPKEGLNFSGLFVLSDTSALGALKAFHDLKINVPEQVSVVGFDGTLEGEFYHPALTTIRIDNEEKFRQAIAILRRRLDNGRDGALCHLVKPELVVRESTGEVK